MSDTGPRHSAGLINNPNQNRYELEVDGYLAVADYQLDGDKLAITCVFVPEELRGKGVAAQVMKVVVEDANAKKLSIVPVCSYAASYLERNPQS